MKCPKCGKQCKGKRGLAIHGIHCPRSNGPKRKSKRKQKVNFEQELMALQIRCELAAKLLMGAI